jgi:hypothetical protein
MSAINQTVHVCILHIVIIASEREKPENDNNKRKTERKWSSFNITLPKINLWLFELLFSLMPQYAAAFSLATYSIHTRFIFHCHNVSQ